MAVSSIGTSGTIASSFYQSVSGGAQPSTLTSIWNPSPVAPDSDTPELDTLQVRRSDEQSLRQLEAAVNSALGAAQQDPTADPNQIIAGAIEQTFQPAATGTTSGANSSGTASANSSAATDPTDPDTSAATQSYLQALRTYGVDPQQFHSDLLSAVKDAQHGNVDPSTVFRHFPLGSSLDAVA